MRRIGITPRLEENDSYYEVRECIDIRWGAFLKELGFLLTPLSVSHTSRDIRSLDLDGVIFSGGNTPSSLEDSPLSRIRDRFEILLMDHCRKNGIPAIGICRGMLFIGEYFGATITKTPKHSGTCHSITFACEISQLTALAPPAETNSYHTFGVSSLNSSWNILARSEDSIIEAAIHTTERLLLLMWHPERNSPFSQFDSDIFQRFFHKDRI